MKISDVMTVEVISVSPKTPIRKLWELIFRKRLSAIPVIDTNKQLVGIIAEEDLLKPLYPDYEHLIEDFVSASDFEEMEHSIDELADLTAEKLMSKKIIFTRSDTPIMRALSRMIVRSVSQLPVVSGENRVIGMVTRGDIFDALFKRHLLRRKPAKTKKGKK